MAQVTQLQPRFVPAWIVCSWLCETSTCVRVWAQGINYMLFAMWDLFITLLQRLILDTNKMKMIKILRRKILRVKWGICVFLFKISVKRCTSLIYWHCRKKKKSSQIPFSHTFFATKVVLPTFIHELKERGMALLH